MDNNRTFEEAAEKKYPLHEVDSEIPCISVNDIVKEYRQVFVEGCEYAAPKWIDVNTAVPESTKDVLCLMYSQYASKKPIQFVGCYTKGHEIEYCDDDYQGEYDEVEDKNGTLYLKPGWYECEETPGASYDEQWLKRDVVAWQPLPSPPTKD